MNKTKTKSEIPKIEDGIPIQSISKYDWVMSVKPSQSFHWDGNANNIRMAVVRNWGKSSYTSRKEGNGYRFWRKEQP